MLGRFVLLVLLGLGLWLALAPPGPGGPGAEVTLAELAAAPAQHDGQRVTVSGRVVDRATVLGLGGVLIADDQGHQVLAAGWTGPATPGERVTVTGTYRVALAVGELQVPLLLTAAEAG
jgi:hypothetical protein